MKGINYITNDNGERIAVMLDLKKYRKIWDDVYSKLLRVNKAKPEKSILKKRKEAFFKFVSQHTVSIPKDYKFDRAMLHER